MSYSHPSLYKIMTIMINSKCTAWIPNYPLNSRLCNHCQLKFSNLMYNRNIKFNKCKFWCLSKPCPLPMFPILVNKTIYPLGSGEIPWKPLYFLWISPSRVINQKTLFLLSSKYIYLHSDNYSSISATNLVQFTTVKLTSYSISTPFSLLKQRELPF